MKKIVFLVTLGWLGAGWSATSELPPCDAKNPTELSARLVDTRYGIVDRQTLLSKSVQLHGDKKTWVEAIERVAEANSVFISGSALWSLMVQIGQSKEKWTLHENTTIAQNAIWALYPEIKNGDPESVQAVMAAAAASRPELRQTAIRVLQAWDPDVVLPVIDMTLSQRSVGAMVRRGHLSQAEAVVNLALAGDFTLFDRMINDPLHQELIAAKYAEITRRWSAGRTLSIQDIQILKRIVQVRKVLVAAKTRGALVTYTTRPLGTVSEESLIQLLTADDEEVRRNGIEIAQAVIETPKYLPGDPFVRRTARAIFRARETLVCYQNVIVPPEIQRP